MSYSRVRVEKVGNNVVILIDGKRSQFSRDTSNILLNGSVTLADDSITCHWDINGIFSTSLSVVAFTCNGIQHKIDFGSKWNPLEFENPLAEIRRRVRLVQETFAKAEAEKEVWEGIVGELPLVEPEKVETFTIICTGDYGEGYKHVTKTTHSLLANELSKFSNPIFVFKGEPETV
jgi:hypothetical protein